MEESIIMATVSLRSEEKEVENYNSSGEGTSTSPRREDTNQEVPSSKNHDSDEEELPLKKTNKRIIRFSDSESDSDKENYKSLPNTLSGITQRTAVKESATSDDSDASVKSKDRPAKTTKKMKRLVTNFSDSDGESQTNISNVRNATQQNDSEHSEASKSSSPISKSKLKSRLRPETSNDSDSNNSSVSSPMSVKNVEQQLRMKNKRQKLQDKFKNLTKNKGGKRNELPKESDNEKLEKDNNDNDSSSDSFSSGNEEGLSVMKIKQVVVEKSIGFNSSLCDPDTSDEESSQPRGPSNQPKVPVSKPKKTKLTSPKPLRMTAKQAMENMQKIKSESNRMLREKEVSLPYHRPRALSLKDIMNKRKPAVAADGKALPIKMNSEQLKQYVSLLEQRQKEMMELCKSESEDEEEPAKEEPSKDEAKNNETEIKNHEEFCLVSTDTNSGLREQSDEILGNPQAKSTEEEFSKCGEIVENKIMDEEEAREDQEQHDSSNPIAEQVDILYTSDITESENIGSKEVAHNHDEIYAEVKEQENILELHSTPDSENVHKANISVEKQIENEQSDSFNQDSEMIILHYEHTENTELQCNNIHETKNDEITSKFHSEEADKTFDEMMKNATQDSSEIQDQEAFENQEDDDCFAEDIDMQEIDSIIENAEIIRDSTSNVNSPMLIKDPPSLNMKPKITGAPGTIIDLDGNDPMAPRKLTGLELLKERFVYFAKLKTPEELEREREKRIKPGIQFIKLKQELEEKIAEQRSLEWAKRLEEEKQHHKEMEEVLGDGSEDDGDDIDKIEAKLEENGLEEQSSSEGEEEPEENDVILEDKPKKRNPMLDDEAEESEHDETEDQNDEAENENDEDRDADSESEESSDESSEEDNEQSSNRKGRILKAFEDSDDETEMKSADNVDKSDNNVENALEENDQILNEKKNSEGDNEKEGLKLKQNSEPLFTDDTDKTVNTKHVLDSSFIKDSQDEDIQLAQLHKSAEDLNVSNTNLAQQETPDIIDENTSTQSFSIMPSNGGDGVDRVVPLPNSMEINFKIPSTVILETQPCSNSLDAVVGMCSGSFSQSLIGSQPIVPPTQEIGDDVLALCTGQFYDNQFVSQLDDIDKKNENELNSETKDARKISKADETKTEEHKDRDQTQITEKTTKDNVLKSILDELDGADFDAPKPNKYFAGTQSSDKEVIMKKRLVIDSDDDEREENPTQPRKKKLKKKKPEKRALQISDDEDEESEMEEIDQESELEDDVGAERLVEYDSEENEVEILPQPKKIKKKASEFLEKEAELTSEDEWVGSGDEDERGLDRMEREEGDDEVFEQGKLQSELGQIHMRDVLDQDKREVRLIQELLFEDGDLGGGGRQRKFRWRNDDGEEETGTRPDDWADTQEEEFESEEMWRKQRHEREIFLRQMHEKEDPEGSPNITFNRTTLIKASLYSKTVSPPKTEPNKSTGGDIENSEIEDVSGSKEEKKTTKDIPSPKKPFSVYQKNYHGSFLSRGNGALARLCALATPLAGDDDSKVATLGPTTHRNFVFSAVSPKQEKPKVTIKRKADNNGGTPKLIKKLKTAVDASPLSKSSLLDTLI